MTIFPDTNALLHYPPLKDVDWVKAAGGAEVKLVLCMQVIHELDEKKNDPRLSRRADRIIREIRTILGTGQVVRPGVSLSVFNRELRATDFAESLSPDSKDDRIVHSVKMYIETTGDTDVKVYTEDLGMMLRCQANGLEVLEPDKAIRLDSPLSEQEKKYKAAITELNRIKNTQPRIGVAFGKEDDVGDGPLRLELQPPRPFDLEAAVERERQELGIPRQPESHGGSGTMSLLSMMVPTEDDWKEYEERCESYLTEFREWAQEDAVAKDAMALNFSFTASVSNDGSAVGEDVDVYLDFPPVIKFIDGDGNDKWGKCEHQPKRPDRPQKPKMRDPMAALRSGLSVPRLDDPSRGFRMPDFSPVGSPWSDFDGTVESGLCLRLFMPKLRHHTTKTFGPFWSGLLDWNCAKPFEVQLTVLAANLPNAAESKIPVIVKVID